jgi:CHC2-type zinc finger protein
MTYALTDLIDKMVGPIQNARSINAMVSCPLHEDRTPSLSIHQEEGVWNCHSCGESGDIAKLARITGEELDHSFYWDRAIRSVTEVPPRQHNFSVLANKLYQNGLTGDGSRAINSYMRNRRIGIDAHHHFWLGWNDGRISIPYWVDDARKQGTCTAIKYRDKNGRKSYEPGGKWGIYNVEEVRGAGSVLICEGESDTHVAWSNIRNHKVCGIPGASASVTQWESWALDFLWATDILIGLDADDAGDRGAGRAMAVLGPKARRVRPDDGLDLTQHFLKYGSFPDGID